MPQTILCDAGDGVAYAIEVGMAGNPVHQFYCPTHFCEFALSLMDAWRAAQLEAEGAEPGTEAEAREVLAGRIKGPRRRPRRVAVDSPDGPLVGDPPAEGATGAGREAG